jgi:hypothetical protein
MYTPLPSATRSNFKKNIFLHDKYSLFSISGRNKGERLKVMFSLEQAMKAQRWSIGRALLFL